MNSDNLAESTSFDNEMEEAVEEITRETLSDSELQEVYTFVDKVPSTRVKKNLNRDFSDGSYMAELIRFYMPAGHKKLVEVHTYIQTGKLLSKIRNWNQLNKRVLTKLGQCSF